MTDKTKPVFAYKDDGLEQRLRKNFLKQGFLIHAGATMGQISPGTVELTLPFSSKVDQHHGFFHGGAIATIADGAAGAAAQTLIARDESILTTEFKINFLAPAIGQQLLARGWVIKAGRTLTICQCDVFAEKDNQQTLIAIALLTMMRVPAARKKEKQDATQ